jgi:hypothetical protein
MNTSSPPVKPETFRDSPFDVRGFKNLLSTLKKSKAQQEDKVKPVYDPEE